MNSFLRDKIGVWKLGKSISSLGIILPLLLLRLVKSMLLNPCFIIIDLYFVWFICPFKLFLLGG